MYAIHLGEKAITEVFKGLYNINWIRGNLKKGMDILAQYENNSNHKYILQ